MPPSSTLIAKVPLFSAVGFSTMEIDPRPMYVVNLTLSGLCGLNTGINS